MSPAPRSGAAPSDPVTVINRLCRELAATRLRYANLLAAALATLSAAREGESDALAYLADEVAAQGEPSDLGHGWWSEVGR